eukprot:1039265-Prymnesium_polylepis.1
MGARSAGGGWGTMSGYYGLERGERCAALTCFHGNASMAAVRGRANHAPKSFIERAAPIQETTLTWSVAMQM